MKKNVALLACFFIVLLIGLTDKVLAQDMTTVANTTNACINSTYKSYTPNIMSPTSILIDRRVTFNPTAVCTTAVMNNANCGRDAGSMLLIASAAGAQITMSPSCSWNCGGCGTIVTDRNIGLPVELMEFSVGSDNSAVEPNARTVGDERG